MVGRFILDTNDITYNNKSKFQVLLLYSIDDIFNIKIFNGKYKHKNSKCNNIDLIFFLQNIFNFSNILSIIYSSNLNFL